MPVLISQKRSGGVVFFYVKEIDGELIVLRSFVSVPPDGYLGILNIYLDEENLEIILIT